MPFDKILPVTQPESGFQPSNLSDEREISTAEQKNKAVPSAEVELSLQEDVGLKLGNEPGFAVLGVLNTA